MNPQTRKPAVAGSFYEARPQLLREQILTYLKTIPSKQISKNVRALIVPHAGHIYSGPIAAGAYQLIENMPFKKIVLIGPSHRVAFEGIALSPADFFETPLGQIPVDHSYDEKLLQVSGLTTSPAPHAKEHCLEVQLPFLQMVLKDFSIIPLVVGNSAPQNISYVIDLFLNDENTLVIVSSDLSHYLPYELAGQVDKQTAQYINKLEFENLDYDSACGRTPIQGLLISASKHHLKPQLLDLRNSGDTAGSHDQVVGYGAWAFYQGEK